MARHAAVLRAQQEDGRLMNADTVWGKACRHLRETLSKDVFDRWIAVIEARSVDDDKLVLAVQNNFYQSWLEENYLPLIQDAVSAVNGRCLAITFAVDRTAASEPAPLEAAARPAPAERPHAAPPRPALNPKYTFDTFVVGPSNSFPARRLAGGGAVARARLQSALPLRRGGPGQDAPDAGHRALRAAPRPRPAVATCPARPSPTSTSTRCRRRRWCSSARSTARWTCC
jgi:hypothetical protein